MHRKISYVILVVLAVATVLLQTSSASTRVDTVQEDLKLAVLDEILRYRGDLIRDKEATVVACDAWRAVGEPSSFPNGLRWADGLLEERPERCGDAPPPEFPRVHVRAIEVSDSGAVATVVVSSAGGLFSEDYRMRRHEDRFTILEVRVFGFAMR